MTTKVTHAYQVAVFISIILVLIPLRWHLQAWNVGTCLYIMWVALGCLNEFINAVVWADDALIRSVIWCDISTHIQVALNVAVPACSLVINRRLYNIAHAKLGSSEGKRKALLGDLAIGLGIPVLSMMVYIIPQGYRFNIYEELGCQFTTYNTIAALLLITSWPLILGCVSAVYAVLIFYTFFKRSAQLNQFIEHNPTLTVSRYWRLMALASTAFVFTIPLSAYVLYGSLAYNVPSIQPWISWDNVHADFGYIGQYPSLLWRSKSQIVIGLEVSRWSYVLCAVVFFAFFGVSAEARRNYCSGWSALCSRTRHTFNYGREGRNGASSSLNNTSRTTVLTSNSGLPLSFRKDRLVNSDSTMDSFGQDDKPYKTTGEFALMPLKHRDGISPLSFGPVQATPR